MTPPGMIDAIGHAPEACDTDACDSVGETSSGSLLDVHAALDRTGAETAANSSSTENSP